MLALDDFDAAAAFYRRRSGIMVAAGAVYLAIGGLVTWFWGPSIREFGWVKGLSEGTRALLAVGATIGPVLILIVGGLLLVEYQGNHDSRLLCPICGKSMLTKREVLRMTRRCGYCGKPILGNPD